LFSEGGLKPKEANSPLVEVEFLVEFGPEGDLAAVVHGGVEPEEVEPAVRRGDGGQLLTA
jgi:hypothetical protein